MKESIIGTPLWRYGDEGNGITMNTTSAANRNPFATQRALRRLQTRLRRRFFLRHPVVGMRVAFATANANHRPLIDDGLAGLGIVGCGVVILVGSWLVG